MTTNQSNYYAIIPASVRYCKDLIPSAKLLYGEITALCNQEGYCWAGNRYFQDLYNVDEKTIQSWLRSLKNLGFIKVEVEKEGMRTKRKIWICEAIQNNFTTPRKDGGRHREKTVVDTAKTPPIIIQRSNTTYKKKQQQAPTGAKASGGVVAFYKCIENIGLSEKDQKAVMKYPEEEVKEAVEFATNPKTKIKKDLISTIIWALNHKPEIPKVANLKENKAIAESIQYNLESKHWQVEALSKKVEIYSKTPTNTTVHQIGYEDPRFEEKFNQLLKECGFGPCKKK